MYMLAMPVGRMKFSVQPWSSVSLLSHLRAVGDAETVRIVKAAFGLPSSERFVTLHICWDNCPAGTTFAGARLSPAGTTTLFTAHLDMSDLPVYSCSRNTTFQIHVHNWAAAPRRSP